MSKTGNGDADIDGDGIDDAFDEVLLKVIELVDTDGDGVPDFVDTDSDNDGRLDVVEAHDYDGDGIADVIPNFS